MVSALDFEAVTQRVAMLETLLLTLEEGSHTRELLIARLCFGGMRLKDAVEVPVKELLASSSEGDLEASLPRYRRTDQYFPRLQPMCLVAKRHCVELRRRATATTTVQTGSQPAFPSRKKGFPVTTRTAERCLSVVISTGTEASTCDYRLFQRVGRAARGYASRFAELSEERHRAKQKKSKEGTERLEQLRDAVRPFLRKQLHESADVDDAVQETLIRLNAKIYRLGDAVSIDDSIKFAIGIAKNVMLEFRRRTRDQEVTNVNDFFLKATTREDLGLEKSRAYEDTRHVTESINSLMGCLNDRQRNVISRIFSQSPSTCREIAESMGMVTRSVQRIKAQALKKLRKEIEKGPYGKLISILAAMSFH
ncbi:sigma-70 family RNA polymerase sigma factor [Aquisphaera insulae]|uniref:sigma-70 family RNA polymerase sigma factor n=1 Tax=Aquisphaera insulae TaxID=2712864 RepID=UPI0013EDCCAF|nr:sigma-70 family RNA polymerase sigma factor [Aquisphaera insulae]